MKIRQRTGFLNGFRCDFGADKTRSGAGCPVDIRLAPTEAERRPLNAHNEGRKASRMLGVLNSYENLRRYDTILDKAE